VIPAELKKFLAFGRGIGIQITGPPGSETLEITALRVRPNGARVLGRLTVGDFPHQPAAAWGIEYAAFLKKLDLRHVPAVVLLPRQDVIVRQLSLRGVGDKDLAAAIEFQMDGLHPYAEGDVLSAWTRLGDTSTVLIAIARRAAIDRYATLFTEAGIKLASFTCSAAAIYGALRIFGRSPGAEILAAASCGQHVELYGESPARPIFSASFDPSEPRAAALACAELRIDPATEPKPLEEILAASPALPYAAALASACPRLALKLNLLPAELRQSSSRANWVPITVAGSMAAVAAIALAAVPAVEERRYESSLQNEIRTVERQANQAARLDRETSAVRARTMQLDEFRRHTKMDLDVVAEMTKILPEKVWLNSLELSRVQVVVAGEAEQAAPLLKTIDASPLFEASEFVGPPTRSQSGGEMFRIRSNREAGK